MWPPNSNPFIGNPQTPYNPFIQTPNPFTGNQTQFNPFQQPPPNYYNNPQMIPQQPNYYPNQQYQNMGNYTYPNNDYNPNPNYNYGNQYPPNQVYNNMGNQQVNNIGNQYNFPNQGDHGINLGNNSVNLGNNSVNLGNNSVNLGNNSVNLGNNSVNVGNNGINNGINLGNNSVNLGNQQINFVNLGNPQLNVGSQVNIQSNVVVNVQPVIKMNNENSFNRSKKDEGLEGSSNPFFGMEKKDDNKNMNGIGESKGRRKSVSEDVNKPNVDVKRKSFNDTFGIQEELDEDKVNKKNEIEFLSPSDMSNGVGNTRNKSVGIGKVLGSITSAKFVNVVSHQTHFQFKNNLTNDVLLIERRNGRPGRLSSESLPDHGFGKQYDCFGTLGIITYEQEYFLILCTGANDVGNYDGKVIYNVTATEFLPFDYTNEFKYVSYGSSDKKPPFHSVQKFLNSGLFYFSYDYHMTLSLQKQSELGEEILQNKPMWKLADQRFFWNKYLQKYLINKRLDSWILVLTRGFASFKEAIVPQSKQKVTLGLISRISCAKAGTRFNSRGVNDDGNVANFVETEQIIISNEDNNVKVSSFLQIRGSVPIFWEQRLTKYTTFKAAITRTKEVTTDAFNKHMDDMKVRYDNVHVVNLLSQGKHKREKAISDAYTEHFLIGKYYDKGFGFTIFDFHEECGSKHFDRVEKLLPDLKNSFDKYGYYYAVNGEKTKSQNGLFRTNCLDCLDRTNVVQGVIGKVSLFNQMKEMGFRSIERDLTDYSALGNLFKNTWADNGDNLSKAYAGTGAIKSQYTRSGKRDISGMFDDGIKSVTRMYNAFKDDENKQSAIDLFLGKTDDIIDDEARTLEERWVANQLHFRRHNFTTKEDMKIYIGTWNINGQYPDQDMDIDQWLTPMFNKDFDHNSISLYVFGFQEIVALTGNAIYNADTTNKSNWESYLQYKLNEKRDKDKKVVLARSEQLVGLAILFYIRQDLIGVVKNIQFEKSKTAVKKLAGNKGALCARFDIKDTSICFINSHLSAGHSKQEQRMKDINQIFNVKFRVPNCPTIMHHDYIYLFGDMNFRLDLDKYEAETLIKAKRMEKLLPHDQLVKCKNDHKILKLFKEGEISFLPTYKYDVGTDQYDTSEKKRTPGWCDRILYCGQVGYIEQIVYDRAECRYSDHRPVKSLFNVEIMTLDYEKREILEKSLYKISRDLKEEVLTKFDQPYDTGDGTLKNDTTVQKGNFEYNNLSEYIKEMNNLNAGLKNRTDVEKIKSDLHYIYSILQTIISKLSDNKDDMTNSLIQALKIMCQAMVNQGKTVLSNIRNAEEFNKLIQLIDTISKKVDEFRMYHQNI